MKVEKKGEYKPMVITLETPEEANLMWHMLNAGEHCSLDQYCIDEHIEKGNMRAFRTSLWRMFNSNHRPEERD